MKRILKIEQFLSAWVVVCRSFRPSFLKTYTVWRPVKRCKSQFTDPEWHVYRGIEDDFEFSEPGKYLSHAGQAFEKSLRVARLGVFFLNATSGTTSWRWDLEGTIVWATHRVLARSHAVSWAHGAVDLPVSLCLSLIHYMPSTLSPRMSCRGRQLALPLRDRGELKGASWVHGICMQVLTVRDITCTFLPRPAAQENWVLKFPHLREEDDT